MKTAHKIEALQRRKIPTQAAKRGPLEWGTRLLAVAGIAALMLASFAGARPDSGEAKYLSPREMVLSNDGRWLYVMWEAGDEVRMVDTQHGTVAKTIAVGHEPRGMALSADGARLYVANSWDDTVSEIDTSTFKVVRTLTTGSEPNGVQPDAQGKTLYVANRLSNDISGIDLGSGQDIKRLAAGRGASYLTLSPNGKLLYATHVYPKIGAHRTPPQSEVTVIDTERQMVVDR